MSRQFWVELIAWATADGTAIANTTTETILFPNVTIPANYMQDGRALRIKAFGKYSTTVTPTLQFWVRWGGAAGTVLCTSAAVTTPSTVTNAAWEAELMIQTRSNGATGTIMANGKLTVYAAVAPTVASATGAAAVTPMTAGGVTAPAAVTVDLTADTALSFTAKWSAASASNTITGHNYELESKN